MSEIQNVLFDKINKNDYGKMLLKYGGILLYIYVGHGLLGMFTMPQFISAILSYTSRIIYFGYVAGLIGCFAKKDFLPIMVVFIFKVLSSLITCIRWFNFGSIVNIIVYGMLGYFAFVCLNKNKENTDAAAVNGKKFCLKCGQEVKAGVSFCENCGHKF